jgi:peptidoglycan hydrolase CwlO-like protein
MESHTNRTTATPIDRRALLGGLAVALPALASASLVRTLAFADDYNGSDETNAALADAQQRYNDAMAQLDQLNNEVFDAEANYQQISSDLDATNQAISDLQTQIEQTQADLDDKREALSNRIAASYKAGDTALLDLVLGADSYEDLTNRVYLANKISDSDAQLIQQVVDAQNELESEQSQLQDQQAQQEQLLSDQQTQLDELNDQVAQTEAYASSLDQQVQDLMAQKQAEIEAQAEAARQAAAAEAAAQAASSQGQGAQVYSVDTSSTASGSDSGSTSGSGGESSGSSSSSGSSGGTGYQPADVVAAAYNYLGTPYSVLDCSGLTSQAYADCGYSLYHQSGVQYNTVVAAGNLVYDVGSLVPGNLVFYSRGGSIYHVAMYVGDGMIIESIPSSGVAVHAYNYCDGYCGGGSPF